MRWLWVGALTAILLLGSLQTQTETQTKTETIIIIVVIVAPAVQSQPSEEIQWQQFEVTAYTAGPESTGKDVGHPAYGITASGAHVQEGHTLACPRSMPFGTQVYIRDFGQIFTCEDRGGAITEGKLDVYMSDLAAALKWGRQTVDVYIVEVE
jgi:3D (Asp-Asp-Asp) domain-containing protein